MSHDAAGCSVAGAGLGTSPVVLAPTSASIHGRPSPEHELECVSGGGCAHSWRFCTQLLAPCCRGGALSRIRGCVHRTRRLHSKGSTDPLLLHGQHTRELCCEAPVALVVFVLFVTRVLLLVVHTPGGVRWVSTR